MGPFPPHGDPHLGRPSCEHLLVSPDTAQFDHPGAVAQFLLISVGGLPRGLRDEVIQLRGVHRRDPPDLVGHARRVRKSSSAFYSPAPSVRINSFLPSRAGLIPDSCARAWRMTGSWSVAVFEPALPGRNSPATGSLVPAGPWSTKASRGWKP